MARKLSRTTISSSNNGKKAVAVVSRPIPLPRKKLTAETLELRKILEAKRRILSGDVSHMEDEALNKTGQEQASQDISNFADLGSDNFEQEFTIGLIENEAEALAEIENALQKMGEGTFGLCEGCGKKIAKIRLRAIPYARLCIECKRLEEVRGGK